MVDDKNPGERRASTAFIVVTLLLDTLGIGLVIPVLPKLIGSFLGGDVASEARYYGGFIAVYAAMQFFFAPVIGGLSDRFGRRPVILASLVGAGLDYVLMALAPSLGWLAVGRVISGITGASFSAATAYITDVTPPERRAQSYGLIGAAFGVGFIVGPALGGLLGEFGLRFPFMAAAVLNLANALYGAFVLPESLARENRRPFTLRRANPFRSIAGLRRHPILFGMTATLVCSYLAQQILQSVWAVYTQGRYGWTPLDVGLSLTAVGVASATIQGGLLRIILPRLGERRALVTGAIFSMAGFTAFALATRGWMLYVILFPFALRGISNPAAQAILTREVGPSEQGELQGSLASLASIAAILGPALGTQLFARFGDLASHPYIPGAPYFAAAALDFVGLLFAVRLFARLPPAAAERTP